MARESIEEERQSRYLTKPVGLSVRTTDYDEHALHANPHLHYGTPTFSPTVDRPGEGVGALSSRHMAPLSPPS
ncbi:hypothetical protein MCOR02_001993 [Pyricularia oryzae]|nr:hypothetical protein MCOR02_001993 [Pyricularia oryzae]KAI6317942.1 hypothetical protein MCOR34_003837 [Pyricularia oryzae]KAI6456731.1 hypothetical protein MCOR17_008136 [Pyricularia oryzae]KAI6508583.1 hypothetical protein MCOR13_002160 [Pyricularia oryzae]KAI6631143.1 hypothetical protein MCOR14_007973 [Pyricularia oryzae]